MLKRMFSYAILKFISVFLTLNLLVHYVPCFVLSFILYFIRAYILQVEYFNTCIQVYFVELLSDVL